MKRIFRRVPSEPSLLLWSILILLVSAPFVQTDEPDWWWYGYSRHGNYWYLKSWSSPADDYAAANIGQLKNFAAAAAAQMDYVLSDHGGSGDEIATLLAGWDTPSPGRDDYTALTAGEAKAVVKKFYDRLAALYAWPAGSQPWPAAPTATTNDFAVINIGQLKNMFSFGIFSPEGDADSDGMSNGYEIRYGLDFRTASGDNDADSDGLTDLMEFWLGLTPTATDSNGNGVADGMEDSDLDGVSNSAELAAGTDPADSLNGADFSFYNVNSYDSDEQLVLQQTRAEVPFKFNLSVYDATTQNYVAKAGLPVVFEVTDGPGTIEDESGSHSGTKQIVYTDADGNVTMYFRGAASKSGSKVRVSLLRLRSSLYTYSTNFALWTSQCTVDADADGMDDVWEDGIINASGGTLTSIEKVLPTDDFDKDSVPNLFEFDRGTDPVNPLSLPAADVVLDEAGAPQESVPVVQTWEDALTQAKANAYDQHPETRGIVKIMPGTYDTYAFTGYSEIRYSVLLWGQGSVAAGVPVLTNTSIYGSVVQAFFPQSPSGSVLALHGLVLDGANVAGSTGLFCYGQSVAFGEPPTTIASMVNCIIRNCPNTGLWASASKASLSFTTMTNCGSTTDSLDTAIYLDNSQLQVANSILWDSGVTQEVNVGWQSSFSMTSSVVGGGNPGITADGRLTPGYSSDLWLRDVDSDVPKMDIDGEDRAPFVQIGADQIADSDGDGLPDSVETGLGSNPFLNDTDGDGTPDGQDDFPLDPLLQTRASGGAPPVIVLESPSQAQPVP